MGPSMDVPMDIALEVPIDTCHVLKYILPVFLDKRDHGWRYTRRCI